ncbi:nucleolar gtp-binding protein 1, partial [Cystoisospora suis]
MNTFFSAFLRLLGEAGGKERRKMRGVFFSGSFLRLIFGVLFSFVLLFIFREEWRGESRSLAFSLFPREKKSQALIDLIERDRYFSSSPSSFLGVQGLSRRPPVHCHSPFTKKKKKISFLSPSSFSLSTLSSFSLSSSSSSPSTQGLSSLSPSPFFLSTSPRRIISSSSSSSSSSLCSSSSSPHLPESPLPYYLPPLPLPSALLARHAPSLPASPSSSSSLFTPSIHPSTQRDRIIALASSGLQAYTVLLTRELKRALGFLRRFPDRYPPYIRAVLLLMISEEKELLSSETERRKIRLKEELLQMEFDQLEKAVKKRTRRRKEMEKEERRKGENRKKMKRGSLEERGGGEEKDRQMKVNEIRLLERKKILEEEMKILERKKCLPSFERVYEEIQALYVELTSTGKAYAARVGESRSVREVKEIYRSGVKALRNLVSLRESSLLDYTLLSSFLHLHAHQRASLHRMSSKLPLLMLVGGPSVGKTSLFLALTAANSYVHEEAKKQISKILKVSSSSPSSSSSVPPSSSSSLPSSPSSFSSSPSSLLLPEGGLREGERKEEEEKRQSSFSSPGPSSLSSSLSPSSSSLDKKDQGEGVEVTPQSLALDEVRTRLETLQKEGKALWEGGSLPDPEDLVHPQTLSQVSQRMQQEEEDGEGEEEEQQQEREEEE